MVTVSFPSLTERFSGVRIGAQQGLLLRLQERQVFQTDFRIECGQVEAVQTQGRCGP